MAAVRSCSLGPARKAATPEVEEEVGLVVLESRSHSLQWAEDDW